MKLGSILLFYYIFNERTETNVPTILQNAALLLLLFIKFWSKWRSLQVSLDILLVRVDGGGLEEGRGPVQISVYPLISLEPVFHLQCMSIGD